MLNHKMNLNSYPHFNWACLLISILNQAALSIISCTWYNITIGTCQMLRPYVLWLDVYLLNTGCHLWVGSKYVPLWCVRGIPFHLHKNVFKLRVKPYT